MKKKMIETLVRLGSTAIDTPDNNGVTPVYAAAQNGHVNEIETLFFLGCKFDGDHSIGNEDDIAVVRYRVYLPSRCWTV